jgi:hypothetical protein
MGTSTGLDKIDDLDETGGVGVSGDRCKVNDSRLPEGHQLGWNQTKVDKSWDRNCKQNAMKVRVCVCVPRWRWDRPSREGDKDSLRQHA